MNGKLKKLSDQVMVITGASSGIGLVTARMAAQRGARLIVNARNEEALRTLCDEIRANGGEAYPVAADVGQFDEVKKIADEAIRRFGGFDTWVNNAGVSIYGAVLDQSLEDSASCLKPITGASFMDRWSLARTCASAAARSSTLAAFFLTLRFRFREPIARRSTP